MRKNVKKMTKKGKLLVSLLKIEGMKQNEFAKLIGITPQTVSDFIYGRIKEGGRAFWDGVRLVFPDWENKIRGNVKKNPLRLPNPAQARQTGISP